MTKVLVMTLGLVFWGFGTSGCGQKSPEQPKAAKTAVASEPNKDKGAEAVAVSAEVKPAAEKNATGGPEVNHGDPKSVAKGALTAIKGRDTEGLVALVHEDWMQKARKVWNPESFKDHRFFKPGTWQQRVVEAWNGDVLEVRRRGRVALVKFAETQQNGETVHYCVSLLEFSGEWFFKDLDNRPGQDFLRYEVWVEAKPEGR